MPPPIPDRWIPYKACGKVIEGTRIICFKVPLRKAVQAGFKEKWDIDTLLEKIPNLGAVIDLTNTSRYYNPEDLQSKGVLYQKILMPGRIIPPEDEVQLFMDTVDEFLGKDNDFLIGVHCTHGLNRTGYMVCRYMRDRLSIPAQTAVKRFEKARGYQIERENYVADLLGHDPPPADTGPYTEVKPISKKKEHSNREQKKNLRISNNNSTEDGDSRRRIRKRRNSGENSSSKRKRTDSERSYDFRYDY